MSNGMEYESDSKASCHCRDFTKPVFSVVNLNQRTYETDTTADCTTDDSSTDSSIHSFQRPPELVTRDEYDDSSVSSVDLDTDDEDDRRWMRTVKVPSFSNILPEVTPSKVPEVIRALNRAAEDIQVAEISAVEYYKNLQVSEVLLSSALPPRGHVDGGALATTTDRRDYIWCYKQYSSTERQKLPRLKVADGTLHVPMASGYLKIPTGDKSGGTFVPTYYTPQIPATIISPDAVGKTYGCRGYHTYSDFVGNRASLDLTGCTGCDSDLRLELSRIRGLLYTDSLVAPTPHEHKMSELPKHDHSSICPLIDLPTVAPCDVPMRELSQDQQRMLWHMRLGHLNQRMVSDLHLCAKGIPKLPREDALHKCPICAQSKIHKSNRGSKEDREPTTCWQDIQVDFGFFVQKSAGRRPKGSKESPRPIRDLEVEEATEPPSEPSTEALPRYNLRNRDRRLASPAKNRRRRRARVQVQDPNVLPQDQDGEQPRPPAPADTQKYVFERITAHQGPLQRSDKRFKGSRFNLKIKWDNGQTTWEPYEHIFQDAPAAVIAYARRNNLLSNRYWNFVREAALSSTPEGTRDADFEDETEMAPSTDDDDIIITPMDPETAAAKATAATERYNRLKGVDGETCYVMITDRYSGSCRVSIRKDKTPPLDFIREFLARYTPDVQEKTVRFDQGGELGGCAEVHDLFRRAGYEVEITGSDSSSEIGLVERPHRTIADAVRTMLYAAKLEPKYWPYALRQWLVINDHVPHGDRPGSPYFMCTGKQSNISLLRVFGCHIYALPPGKRTSKLDVRARKGIFLGYKRSMRHAYYLDDITKEIKVARHIVFDEGRVNDDDPPPYVKLLRGEVTDKEQLHLDDATQDMAVSLTPFNEVEEYPVKFRPDSQHPLGFQMGKCPRYLRAYVNTFTRSFATLSKQTANQQLLGSYVLKVGDVFTFTPEDVARAIEKYSRMDSPPPTLTVRLAKDQRVDLAATHSRTLNLRPIDIRRIAAMPLVAGEGNHIQQRERLRELSSILDPGCTPPDPEDLEDLSAAELLEMRQMANEHMTPEERKLPSFSRRNVMRLPNWEEWRAADRKQLDSHFDAGTIGKAVPRPVPKPGEPSQVFRTVQVRVVKSNGVRKSRTCLDGSKRAAPWIRNLVQTYSNCIELPTLRAFIAVCVNRGYAISFGDVENAYQQAPPPTYDCYLEIDDTIADWYEARFGVVLDRKNQVLPLFRALQGHVEAGVLWQRMIDDILINKMGFRNLTHEKSIYVGQVDGKEVLVCRQVDDLATASKEPATSEAFIKCVQKYVTTEYAGMGVPSDRGTYQKFNGLDIHQTQDYVKISCESYIDNMLRTHGWDAPTRDDSPKTVPISPSIADKLQRLEGPAEKTTEARLLEKRMGFSYRNLLGELMYAYVVCRLDIGYSVCLLARFSAAPHEEHFLALKQTCKYLRANKSWGIMYCRPKPLSMFPKVPFEFLEDDPNLPDFPKFKRDELWAMLDAAHGTDLKTRRSVTGLVVMYCNAAIAWKSRLQSLVSTSSTEAEFYAAVTCAKLVKYLRYVLMELDAMAPGPSPLLIDNEAAENMINEERPTPRARHIEIQHFAIQEWRKKKDIIMKHLPGTMNSSDSLTKALSWVLHYRHVRRAMGHHRPVSSVDSVVAPNLLDDEAGEGVGAQAGRGS